MESDIKPSYQLQISKMREGRLTDTEAKSLDNAVLEMRKGKSISLDELNKGTLSKYKVTVHPSVDAFINGMNARTSKENRRFKFYQRSS